MAFTSSRRGARLARRLVSHRLDTRGHPYGSATNDTLTLITAELAANAVRHGHVTGRDFDLRLARQERIFFQDDGPRVEMVLDEGALRRQIGGPAVLRRQLGFLKQLITEGKAVLRALPFSAGCARQPGQQLRTARLPRRGGRAVPAGPSGVSTVRDDREVRSSKHS